MSRRDDAEEIRRRLDERIEAVLDRYAPGWVARAGTAYLTPKNAKDLGSFQVHLKGARRGQWYRFSQKIGGGSVELISYLLTNGVTAYAQAFSEARSFLGMSHEPSQVDDAELKARRDREAEESRRRREKLEAEEDRRRRRRAESAAEIWQDCVPITGTLAEGYLTKRGIVVPPSGWPDDAIGFHEGLVYRLDPSEPVFPALVGRIVDVAGETIAVHQIFLDRATGGKIALDPAKITFGPAKGGAIRLGGTGEHINPCEGLETGFGVWALLGFRTPVWPGIGTSGLAGLELPLQVKRITVWPDGDRPMRWQGRQAAGEQPERLPGVTGEYVPAEPAGRAAAAALRERALRFGVACTVMQEPIAGKDYLDIWNETKAFA